MVVIYQSCHLYFLSNQTQPKFNQDFKACWCFCSCCWAEVTLLDEETEFPTCVFGLDTVSCASIHKVVFFGKVVFKDKDKTEVWTKVESIDLKTQRMWTLCVWEEGSKLIKRQIEDNLGSRKEFNWKLIFALTNFYRELSKKVHGESPKVFLIHILFCRILT